MMIEAATPEEIKRRALEAYLERKATLHTTTKKGGLGKIARLLKRPDPRRA